MLILGATRESSRTLRKASSLAGLMRLLLIITQELDFCSIWPENCWLFCSIIQQYFVASDDGWSSDTIQNLKHINLGRSIRRRVFAQYRTNHGTGLHPENRQSILQIDTTSSNDRTPLLGQDDNQSNMYGRSSETAYSRLASPRA
ncbi:hypothetical protein DL93DRAFT_245178 [Clavulina sp. PMI_390]|nr:hypothetical protein DL93DRAFT_245178 [Clavulina sp. PMI_390]